MLAAMLTAVIRSTLPLAPAFCFAAPIAVAGKTAHASCVSLLAGQEAAPMPQCRTDEEYRKRLLAVRRAGAPVVFFDNVRGELNSSALEMFLTSREFSDRKLGESEMLSFSTKVLVLISGNNLQPVGDLYRRIITVHIDPKTGDPERRAFALDPIAFCRAHRQAMVQAALTLLQAYLHAGAPRLSNDRLASFEDWDDRVRQPVLWLGRRGIADLGDPTHCIHAAKAHEPGRELLRQFLVEVFERQSGQPWTSSELIAAVYHQDLIRAITDAPGPLNPHRLGRWLHQHSNIRIDGLHLQRAGQKQGSALWQVRCDEDGRYRRRPGISE